jgi:uncharacterized membrane protein
VGVSYFDGLNGALIADATEWSSDGTVLDLGGLGSYAGGINDSGQVLASSSNFIGPIVWNTDGSVIDLENPPGSIDEAGGINDSGQVAGFSIGGGIVSAAEWSIGGKITILGDLPGFDSSEASGINAAGQVVGFSSDGPSSVPEPSTWAMMCFGFAALALAGYRRAKAGRATLAR